MKTDGGPDDALEPEAFNTRAFALLLVSVFVGAAGLFALPAIQGLFGLAFGPAFAIILAVEFLAAIGVIVAVLRLHREPTFE
jgi:hypothetical protein